MLHVVQGDSEKCCPRGPREAYRVCIICHDDNNEENVGNDMDNDSLPLEITASSWQDSEFVDTYHDSDYARAYLGEKVMHLLLKHVHMLFN